MIITQVALGCHRQNTTIPVAEPFGEDWNIHSFFNGLSGKKVTEVVMRYPGSADDLASLCQGFLTFSGVWQPSDGYRERRSLQGAPNGFIGDVTSGIVDSLLWR
jgi:hypothetical protein